MAVRRVLSPASQFHFTRSEERIKSIIFLWWDINGRKWSAGTRWSRHGGEIWKSELKCVRGRKLWIIVPSARGSAGQHTIGQPGRLHSGSDVFTEDEHLGLGRRTKTKKDKDAFKKGDIYNSWGRCSAHHEDCHNTEQLNTLHQAMPLQCLRETCV